MLSKEEVFNMRPRVSYEEVMWGVRLYTVLSGDGPRTREALYGLMPGLTEAQVDRALCLGLENETVYFDTETRLWSLEEL